MDDRLRPEFHLGGPHSRPSPLMTFLAIVVGSGLLVVAFFLGVVVLAVVAGLAILASLILGIRSWWLRRRGLNGHTQGDEEQRESTLIEGEYTVVKRSSRRDRQ